MSSFELGAFPTDLYTMNVKIDGVAIIIMVLVSDTLFITKIQPNSLIDIATPRLLRVP